MGVAAASPWVVLRRELVVREPNEAEGCDLTTRSVWRRGSASVGWGGGNAHASGCVRGAGGRSGSVRAYILLSNLLHELRTRGEMQKMQRCDGLFGAERKKPLENGPKLVSASAAIVVVLNVCMPQLEARFSLRRAICWILS